MEKRALLAFVLSLLVLFGYQFLYGPKIVRKTLERPAVKGTTNIAKESGPILPLAETKEGGKKAQLPFLPPEGEKKPEKLIIVETDLAIYQISTRGAVIKDITLKKYHDDQGKEIHLFSQEPGFFPLQLLTNRENNRHNFLPSRGNFRVGDQPEKNQLTMTYRNPTGGLIRKTFTFQRDSYQVGVKISQNVRENFQILVGSHFLGKGEKETKTRYSHNGPVLDLSGDIKRIQYKDVKPIKVLRGKIPWLAFESKYFMTALLSNREGEGDEDTAAVKRIQRNDGTIYTFGINGIGKINNYVFYGGPKDYELLKSLHNGLEGIINFGIFGVLGKPIFFALKAIFRVVGNYGVAIILLTTLIKIIFFPLTFKQQKSMQDMKKIQPEMNAIREKYKKDPQRMNREIMELYKKNKVNPAAGCFPLLIQIPVFFALYYVLLNAIELRQAPFLYIKDLTSADALFGHIGSFAVGPLPLLMGVSMYLQQKMMPSAMDPKQAKIFQYMPVLFTVMFLNFPSGLVLYWFINNVLTIVQQIYINKKA